MLTKKTIAEIAKFLKISNVDFEAAIIHAEEKEIAIDEKLSAYTSDEMEQLKNNEYKKGKLVGLEMDIKDAKEKFGLDFTGKTMDGLLEAHSKKVLQDSKIEPEKKYSELNERFSSLQKTVSDYETRIAEKDNEVAGIKINNELYKHIPSNSILEPSEIVQIMRSKGFDFKMVDGHLSSYKDGKELQDKLSNPTSAQSVVSDFVKERNFAPEAVIVPHKGRGLKDQMGPTTAVKLSELKQKFQDEGKSLLGQEFSRAAIEAAKSPEFDMNN